MLIKENHIALTSCTDVDHICQPLFEHTPISYFTQLIRYNDGSRIYLTSNANWVEYFFQHKFYQIPYIQTPLNQFDTGYYSWDACPDDALIRDGREYFNIDHRFMIVEKLADYHCFYSFGAHKNFHQATNFYLSHLGLLHKFINYFKEKSQPLIRNYQQQRIILPHPGNLSAHKTDTLSLPDKQGFIDSISTQRYWLNDKSYFTKREFECAKCIVRGMSSKEIASQLNISARTIEKYIESIKTKLNCHRRSEIVRKLLALNFIHA
ncbi:MAG: helix-turn-helix transcriptional regulator [Gammaproteobacteria bacterium]|nr:helix-turn-helix transcriptional regulator [Gammaproteobacteria bacterium]